MADRETLFFSVRCFIEAVAAEQPTMLVFEDIHWADRGLLDLIELLARAHARTARPATDARAARAAGQPARLGRWAPGYISLPLQPLVGVEARRSPSTCCAGSRSASASGCRPVRRDGRGQSAVHRAAGGDRGRAPGRHRRGAADHHPRHRHRAPGRAAAGRAVGAAVRRRDGQGLLARASGRWPRTPPRLATRWPRSSAAT